MRSRAALGVKLAAPERDVVVMLGDGSYLMANSEIATAVAMESISPSCCWTIAFWLHQQAAATCGGARSITCGRLPGLHTPSWILPAHAASLGATACKVSAIPELEVALARRGPGVTLFVIELIRLSH